MACRLGDRLAARCLSASRASVCRVCRLTGRGRAMVPAPGGALLAAFLAAALAAAGR